MRNTKQIHRNDRTEFERLEARLLRDGAPVGSVVADAGPVEAGAREPGQAVEAPVEPGAPVEPERTCKETVADALAPGAGETDGGCLFTDTILDFTWPDDTQPDTPLDAALLQAEQGPQPDGGGRTYTDTILDFTWPAAGEATSGQTLTDTILDFIWPEGGAQPDTPLDAALLQAQQGPQPDGGGRTFTDTILDFTWPDDDAEPHPPLDAALLQAQQGPQPDSGQTLTDTILDFIWPEGGEPTPHEVDALAGPACDHGKLKLDLPVAPSGPVAHGPVHADADDDDIIFLMPEHNPWN